MIRFACPGCSSTFSVPDEKAGKSGKCPKCQAQFIIPQPEGSPAAPPPLPANAPAPGPPPLSVTTINIPAPQPPAADPNAPVEIDPCPKCQTKLSVATSDLGNDVECPYCKTVFKAERAGTRPPAPPPAPEKKSSFETDFSSRPKAKKERDADDDDRPRRRKRDDDDDDRPSRRRRDDDEDDDDRPSRRRRAAASRDDDDDDQPSRRRSSRRDDDDDDDDRPRRRRSRRGGGGSGQKSAAVTVASAFTILIGVFWLIGAGFSFFGGAFFYSLFGGVPRRNIDPAAREALDGFQTGFSALFIGCGVVLLLVALLHILGGVFAIQRKQGGRIMVIVCSVLGIVLGIFALIQTFNILLSSFTPSMQTVLSNLLSLLLTLGYGIFTLVTMCRSDYAEEFS
jgi:DNA-directed RNA polymerase subunit RPC12/RpoP